MMKFGLKVAGLAAAMMIGAGTASAQSVTIDMTGSMPDNGGYGNTFTLPSSAAPGALQVKVTGWQASQAVGFAVTKAYVGAYSPGTGVTGVGDYDGNYGNHQIDNAYGYTDFVLLQFSSAVTLNSLYLKSFTLGNGVTQATTKDNDLAFIAVNIPQAAWNSTLDLTTFPIVPGNWTTPKDGNGGDGSVATGSSAKSYQWLVGAAFNSGNNDGFKITSVTVTPAVPEPATWTMMILGFGTAGFAMRRRKLVSVRAATA